MPRRIAARLMKHIPWLNGRLELLFGIEARIAAAWAAGAHERLMHSQWAATPQPENFDHHIDLFFKWLATRNPLWVERGVFGSLVLRGGDVLELACGDGFNARNFYSLRSRRVVACDFDARAIATAKKKNHAPNVEFLVVDVRTAMPKGQFQNVIWDAAIEHFLPSETDQILVAIKDRLTADGILSGYTIVGKADSKSLSYHEYEFKSKEDLLRVLTPHFRNATVFETIYPERHNLYFWASDAELPFSPGWPGSISTRKE